MSLIYGISVLDFESTRSYLLEIFKNDQKIIRRSQLAKILGCQNSFISLVLTERSQFSLEQAMKISEFLEHTDDEQKYFMLLIHWERAGSTSLKDFYKKEMKSLKIKSSPVENRISQHEKLSSEDQARYYSQWWYSAIHILVAFEHINTVSDLESKIKLPRNVIMEALDFLKTRSFIVEKNSRYEIGKQRIHVGIDSPYVVRHHSNWRLKAIEKIESTNSMGLHYTNILGMSHSDGNVVKQSLLNTIKETEKILEASPVEKPYLLLIDWVEL